MVGIESLPCKKMGYATNKWLKTQDFGSKCIFHGMKYTYDMDEKQFSSAFP